MSLRYTGAWLQDGAFNPLTAPTPIPVSYTYELWSWGRNTQGQLGLGDTTNRSLPVQVGTLTNWDAVNCGTASTIAYKTDGTLWSWGRNTSGELGVGNTTYYSSPKQVGLLTNWSENFAGGGAHTVAIKTDGTLWSWGQNNLGQLGLGNITYYSSPVQVGSLTNWASVSCGNNFTVSIKTNGTLWSWGGNGQGQLGLNSTTNYSSPKQVGALTNWLSAACGRYHVIAVKTNGTLWSWGLNTQGQLGLGNTSNYYSSPTQIGALTTWSKVGCGTRFSFAISTSGALWAWGQNNVGQIALSNTATNYSSPKQIGTLTNWLSVSGGSYHAMALKTDGTIWTWGQGTNGQLGNGALSNYSSPVQVGSLTTWYTVPKMPMSFFSLSLKY
jgi:alpha-tubulin suppressor-like RCC1 family protein